MTHCTIYIQGHEALLFGSKMLWIPELKLLCASDIHFEKGSFFRRFGTLLPPYDTEATLAALEAGIGYFKPDIFVALGDSFHDRDGGERLQPALRARLQGLIAGVPRWIWVMGNHDPAIAADIPGQRAEDVEVGGIWFRHEAQAGDGAEVSGHYHPKIWVPMGRKQQVSGACFVFDGKRLIMPAFGSFTGGLDIGSADFLTVMPQAGRRVYLTYEGNVFLVPELVTSS